MSSKPVKTSRRSFIGLGAAALTAGALSPVKTNAASKKAAQTKVF